MTIVMFLFKTFVAINRYSYAMHELLFTSVRSLSKFQKDLIEADKEITEEAGYTISDGYAAPALKSFVNKHLDCLKRVQEPEDKVK